MREIKFRAWDYDNMIYQTMHGGAGIIDLLMKTSNDAEIMQYTGLKDKNGQEIYEGDVYIGLHGYKYIVEWDNPHACFIGRSAIDTHEVSCVDNINMQIIGNIYENPELLK